MNCCGRVETLVTIDDELGPVRVDAAFAITEKSGLFMGEVQILQIGPFTGRVEDEDHPGCTRRVFLRRALTKQDGEILRKALVDKLTDEIEKARQS